MIIKLCSWIPPSKLRNIYFWGMYSNLNFPFLLTFKFSVLKMAKTFVKPTPRVFLLSCLYLINKSINLLMCFREVSKLRDENQQIMKQLQETATKYQDFDTIKDSLDKRTKELSVITKEKAALNDRLVT